MFSFPKTERGLRSRIARYRAALSREKRIHAYISDGGGTRYVIFWLLFLLNDPQESKKYIRWYAKEFDEDIGEPLQRLCLALMLYRMGDTPQADYALADLMLANQYFIPAIVGVPGPGRTGGRLSDYQASCAEEIPSEIPGAISASEITWMAERYGSLVFRRLRKRFAEIETELDRLEVGPKRSELVSELYGLLEKHKKEITANNPAQPDA
jgi:hypothetical protein